MDDRCCMPMHALITDLVESRGDLQATKLPWVCACVDTLARFIRHTVSSSDDHQFKHLSQDAFTVVLADNLDLMHSFAWVFCGRQTSSWHGTTVQVAQPLPSLSLPTNTLLITTCHKYSVSGPISQGMSSHDNHVTDPLANTSQDVSSLLLTPHKLCLVTVAL